MANIKVSELPTATEFNDDDYVMIVQSNTNKKITKENMYKNYIYSMSETVIGKWVDDKPIYRIVYTGTASNAHNINLSISNLSIEHIINAYGWVNSIYSQWWPIDNYLPSEYEYWTSMHYTTSSFSIDTGNNFSYPNYRVIIEYTKTTD